MGMEIIGKEWVEVFASPQPAQISALRSALTNENFDFSIQGELTLAHHGCATLARVFVLRSQERRAQAVVRRLSAALES
jgi:hypothetical protein